MSCRTSIKKEIKTSVEILILGPKALQAVVQHPKPVLKLILAHRLGYLPGVFLSKLLYLGRSGTVISLKYEVCIIRSFRKDLSPYHVPDPRMRWQIRTHRCKSGRCRRVSKHDNPYQVNLNLYAFVQVTNFPIFPKKENFDLDTHTQLIRDTLAILQPSRLSLTSPERQHDLF